MMPGSPRSSWFALATLAVVTMYALIDVQVLSLLAQQVKTDLGLSDTQLGSLRGVGAVLFTAIAVLPLGWLADRMDRRWLLAGCILVWSCAVASCGLAAGYWSMLAGMAFLAAGEAGLSPIVYAMIPQLFVERQRIAANFIFYAATVLSAGVGLATAGLVIGHIGWLAQWLPSSLYTREIWRLVLFTVAVPGPLLALAVLTIRIKAFAAPAKAHRPGPASAGPRLGPYLASHWRAVFGVFGPFGLTLLGVGAVLTWLPVILTRQFAYSAGDVGVGLGVAVGVGSVAGLAIAAVSARMLMPKWGAAATPVRLSQIGYVVLAAVTPLYGLARSPIEMFVIAGVQMAAANSGNALMPTVVQGLAPATLRGRVFAISTMIATLMQVISPIAVGVLSDHVFTGSGGLLLSSVTFGTPCLFLAAITMRLNEKHILRTLGEVREGQPEQEERGGPEDTSPPHTARLASLSSERMQGKGHGA